jgi:hypothetical protein
VQFGGCRSTVPLKAFDDWTLRTPVAVAVFRKMLKGHRHFLKLPHLALQDIHVLKGNSLYVRAGTIAVAPQCNKFCDLLNREAEIAGTSNEA